MNAGLLVRTLRAAELGFGNRFFDTGLLIGTLRATGFGFGNRLLDSRMVMAVLCMNCGNGSGQQGQADDG